ncbi:HAD family phosphatase [Rhodovastum atsumiense]|nr:HAD family phosphatase [Rhodovastum atsumiense]
MGLIPCRWRLPWIRRAWRVSDWNGWFADADDLWKNASPKEFGVRRFGLLFDLDGTLVDSDALHRSAFAEVLSGADVVVDEAYYRSRIAGRSNDLVIAEAFPSASQEYCSILSSKKEAIYRENMKDIKVIPGAREIIEWAKSKNICRAIVTTSPRASVEAVLVGTDLLSSFDLLVVGDEVQRGKPDPLPYLAALMKLGIDSDEAVAFEDSLPGLASATGAGIPTVGMLASLSERTALLAGAIITAKDFRDAGLRLWLEERHAASASM